MVRVKTSVQLIHHSLPRFEQFGEGSRLLDQPYKIPLAVHLNIAQRPQENLMNRAAFDDEADHPACRRGSLTGNEAGQRCRPPDLP